MIVPIAILTLLASMGVDLPKSDGLPSWEYPTRTGFKVYEYDDGASIQRIENIHQLAYAMLELEELTDEPLVDRIAEVWENVDEPTPEYLETVDTPTRRSLFIYTTAQGAQALFSLEWKYWERSDVRLLLGTPYSPITRQRLLDFIMVTVDQEPIPTIRAELSPLEDLYLPMKDVRGINREIIPVFQRIVDDNEVQDWHQLAALKDELNEHFEVLLKAIKTKTGADTVEETGSWERDREWTMSFPTGEIVKFDVSWHGDGERSPKFSAKGAVKQFDSKSIAIWLFKIFSGKKDSIPELSSRWRVKKAPPGTRKKRWSEEIGLHTLLGEPPLKSDLRALLGPQEHFLEYFDRQ